MFKTIVFIVAVLITVNVSASIALAHGPSDELVIPQATSAPKIDGKLNDSLWNAFEPVEWGLINEGGEVDADQFSRSWAAYDDKFLYVAFENLEPNTGAITTISPGHDVDVWRDDENESDAHIEGSEHLVFGNVAVLLQKRENRRDIPRRFVDFPTEPGR